MPLVLITEITTKKSFEMEDGRGFKGIEHLGRVGLPHLLILSKPCVLFSRSAGPACTSEPSFLDIAARKGGAFGLKALFFS